MLPNDYPHHKSVYHYFNQWSKQQLWEKMHVVLVKKVRKKAGRKKRPTASSVDSQSIKTNQAGEKLEDWTAANASRDVNASFWWTHWACC
ncbi:hypothetical protein GCM10027577_48470 [Spirosoma fluminis]